MNFRPSHFLCISDLAIFCAVRIRLGTMHMTLFLIFKTYSFGHIRMLNFKKYGTLTVCHGIFQIRCIFCHQFCQKNLHTE